VFVLFKKDRIPFFELATPTSEETKSLKKPASEKSAFTFTNSSLRGNDEID
jgi:hypothetical protein